MTTKEHNAKLEQKRKEREKKDSEDSPTEKRELVMHGAKLKCEYASGLGELMVTSNEILLQEKLIATEGDGNNMVNLQFKGTCGHPKWPAKNMSPPPCMSVIKLSPWQNLGTGFMQEQKVLVKESTITCNPDFNSAVASPIPKVESIKSTQEKIDEFPKILDAYFVKWTSDKGTIIEKDEEVYDKKLKKNVTIKKKIQTNRISTEKITERGLSYQLALIIETEGLSGKKIKVRVKSAKKKVLSEVDTEVSLIDFKDIEAVTDSSKYKGIKSKDEFEIEVDNYFNNQKIENAADFKNKAVLRLMINQRADDLSFNLAELIIADSEKNALVYIEVESTESNIEYKGKEGKSGLKNTFLNEDGKYFTIKYLEQPWLVTARKERKLGVSEATHCSKIIDEYHQVNREHKPSGCKTITNAWCASFVGWCLKQNNFSAQLDPGAFSYGEIKTRYRNKKIEKTINGKKVVETKEVFEEPIWGQKTEGGKIAVGSICVVNSKKHVTFAVAKDSNGSHFFGLGGNQGDEVKVSAYSVRNSSVYPIEYTILEGDYELPIYYRELTGDTVA